MSVMDTQIDYIALYAEYHPYLVSYCRKHLISREDAEDMAQTVWLKALQNTTQTRLDNAPAWLTTIARNALRDFYKRRARQQGYIPSISSLDDIADGWDERRWTPVAPDMPLDERAEWIEILVPAWEQCTEEQRAALRLVLEGYPTDEIGPMMGKQPGAGKALLHRARENFRKIRKQQW